MLPRASGGLNLGWHTRTALLLLVELRQSPSSPPPPRARRRMKTVDSGVTGLSARDDDFSRNSRCLDAAPARSPRSAEKPLCPLLALPCVGCVKDLSSHRQGKGE